MIRWGPLVAVSRYDDVKAVLRDTETFSSRRSTGSRITARKAQLSPEDGERLQDLVDNEGRWMVQIDDPEHARLRRFVNHAFSRNRIDEMRGQIEEIAASLLDAVDARGDGRVELVSEYCYKLPLQVVCQLLGARADEAEQIRAWSDAIGEGVGTEYANLDQASEAFQQFQTYVKGLIERTRQSAEATDLFSELVATDDNGTYLSEDELTSMFVQLLFAGHETTTNLISNAVVDLIRNPAELAKLREDPSLIRGSVDEFLRYHGSIQAIHRVATRDCEVAGFEIKKGETVRVLLGSANHDSAVFDDPERLDLTRPNAKKHVGLGFGIHTCLGMWLTRLETEVALKALLERYPVIELDGPVNNRLNFTLHGPGELRLKI